MKQEILVNSTPQESRIAIMEDGVLAEFLIERKEEMGIAGNIYKGKVSRVLPGMQAAFIDIGMEKAGFLHASDFYEIPGDIQIIEATGDDAEFTEPPKPPPSRRLPLEKRISSGEDILVQVAKDPLGTKGARVTSHVSLPGRYMVFVPGSKNIGISRRIESDEERKRLKEIAQSLGTEEGGFILRTACEGRSKREIQRDLRFLTLLWKRIQQKAEASSAPALIHHQGDSRFLQHGNGTGGYRFVQGSPARRRFRAPVYAASQSENCLSWRQGTLVRPLRHRGKSSKGAGPPGLAPLRRLSHHRENRGAHGDRRQYRPIRRQAQSRGYYL
jgi:Ribonuclease G/E